jgi:hypothetical protein
MRKQYFIAFLALACMCSCKDKSEKPLFELKDGKEIGIDFTNTLIDKNEFNVYKYRNYYNGGGVAIGDINNDGLVDVYMVANQTSNKLYLNKGNFKFEDITEKAKVGGERAWSTGVTMADVNGDGLLDIYVCNSGDINGDNKENELFINNGDLTFTEQAAEYGLNDRGLSTHMSFFDYDKDGDLDAYLLNNSFRSIGSFDLRKNQREVRDTLGGDKLFRNDNGKFVDVSKEAGIYGSVIGFGLGITVGDVNNDNWEDIFISNDFFERDYLYINQKNGTFKEVLTESMQAVSAASMGADIADINNDGWNDLFVTDMLPLEYERLKTVTTFDDWNRYKEGVETGYHHQFTRNVLHLNNKNGTFSEVGRMLGVEASDWSWGALFFDMQNDGNKDLFIANGIYRDLTNQDYLQYIANDQIMRSIITDKGVDYKRLIDIIPSNKVKNQAYFNEGGLKFREYRESGLWTESFSNGSAYGDLDNDGDLDLIVNNLNMPSFVYENQGVGRKEQGNFVKIHLKGESKNTFAIGARIVVTDGKNQYTYDCQPARGFQSSMDPRPNIGVGLAEKVDVKIVWPSGKITKMDKVATNTTITVEEKMASLPTLGEPIQQSNINSLTLLPNAIPYTHTEANYNEFNMENLKHYMMSNLGPRVAKGDVDGDGMEDLVMPNGKTGDFRILIHKVDGTFTEKVLSPYFQKYKDQENVAVHLFDADGDGDLDMYVASGGVEISEYSEGLFDDLLFNDGKGNFESSMQQLPDPKYKISTGAVVSTDIDGDGDLDLFVGERVKIGNYGAPCSGYILINDGKGRFTNQTQSRCPGLENIGMISDASFADLDGDGKEDLVVVGEFMQVSIFKNDGKGKLLLTKNIANSSGWWNVVTLVDVDGDGDKDIVAGNLGMNSRFRASTKNPVCLYFYDYDGNGFGEAVMTKKMDDGKEYPYALRHSLMSRLPFLKKKYSDYVSFKNADFESIFGIETVKNIKRLEANEFESKIYINDGKMDFTPLALPRILQQAPIFAIYAIDIDGDNDMDLICGGNLLEVQPEYGRYDADYGHILINDGKGNYTDQANNYGFSVKGAVRSITSIKDELIVFRNNDVPLVYQIKK